MMSRNLPIRQKGMNGKAFPGKLREARSEEGTSRLLCAGFLSSIKSEGDFPFLNPHHDPLRDETKTTQKRYIKPH